MVFLRRSPEFNMSAHGPITWERADMTLGTKTHGIGSIKGVDSTRKFRSTFNPSDDNTYDYCIILLRTCFCCVAVKRNE
jgi:hypothetical protein